MDILQWLVIINVSLAILSVIFWGYNLVTIFHVNRQRKTIMDKKTSSKRREKRNARQLAQLAQKRKKILVRLLIFFFFGTVSMGVASYATYYQATSLSQADTEFLTDGYYYVRDLQDELLKMEAGEIDEATSDQTLTYLATSLASYSVKKASALNNIEGQSVLNRYYRSLSELGINASKQQHLLFSDPELVAELLSDLTKTNTYQTEALTFYKVDEAVLKAQK